MFELSGPVFLEIQGINLRPFCGIVRNFIFPSAESIGLLFLLWAYIFVHYICTLSPYLVQGAVDFIFADEFLIITKKALASQTPLHYFQKYLNNELFKQCDSIRYKMRFIRKVLLKCARSAGIINFYHDPEDPLILDGGLKMISNSYKK